MMRGIKARVGRFLFGFLGLFAFFGWGHAAPTDGTWKFERSMDYYGRTPVNKPLRFPVLVIATNSITLSENCKANFSETRYFFSDVFQPLSKEGGTAKQLDAFLKKNFDFTLQGTKSVYSLVPTEGQCERPVMEFFQIGDRLVIPVGVTFYTYVKADQATKPPAGTGPAPSIIDGYRLSRLPFDFDRYVSQCRPQIVDSKGKPHPTDKCGPEFYPYVADPKKSDALMSLIGNHNYGKWGQEYTQGFSPPFIQKTEATFLVFPPMKDVVLVRVDDFEVVRNEERDIMTGAYLSVVGGKIVDQISGCHFTREYVCVEDGRPVAQLRDNGKIQRF